jgi:hypothetical protein
MKRDMDLIRKILLEIEKHSNDTDLTKFDNIEQEGYSDSEIYYHVELLREADLIDVDFLVGGPFIINRLTWKGHEFLDTSRHNTIWEKAKKQVLNKTGNLSFEILKQVLIRLTIGQIFPQNK